MIKPVDIAGAGGGGKGGAGGGRTPREAPNSLRSNAVARIVDLLGEGEIGGLVDGFKSVYLDEVPVQNPDDSVNFAGFELQERTGLPDQAVAGAIADVANIIPVGTEIAYGTPVERTIANTAVDDVKIIIEVPALHRIDQENGDINTTTVQVRIAGKTVSAADWTDVHTMTISGKCVASYQRAYRIRNLAATFGADPAGWLIRVTKLTSETGSAYLQNTTNWYAYTEIINERLLYPDSAYMALTANAEAFGNRIPRRAYHVRGIKVLVPSNYNVPAGITPAVGTILYTTGVWDGTFAPAVAWTDNPAWVLYDLLTNPRYGLGLDAGRINRYAFYEIARYCDAVDPDGRFAGVDNGYGVQERRFTCNTVINAYAEAYHLVNALASVFMAMPYWATGTVEVVQDRPRSPARDAVAADVENGAFSYEGTGLDARHTVAVVWWNDPDDFYRLTPEVVSDPDGIRRYGYRSKEITAFACTSRGQAHRVGRWLLDSEQNQTETVTFVGGLNFADCLPGEIINVADAHYAEVRLGGRMRAINGTLDRITIDAPVTLTTGNDTLSIVLPDGTLTSATVTTTGAAITELQLDAPLPQAPAAGAVWTLAENGGVQPRQFRVVANEELAPHRFQITALFHDPDKYARVEQGIVFDPAPYAKVPGGMLQPPGSITVGQIYDYTEGQNNLFGLVVSWLQSPDARTVYYQLQARLDAGVWTTLHRNAENTFDFRGIVSGVWDFRVRAVGHVHHSAWSVSTGHNLAANTGPPPDVTGLGAAGGGTDFAGRDCEITWDPLTFDRLDHYRIEIRVPGTEALLRTETVPAAGPRYVYTYAKNLDDGGPRRNIIARVWAVDVFGQLATNYAAAVFSNPAPSMATQTPGLTPLINGVKITWTLPADNDLYQVQVLLDKNMDPVTAVAVLGAGGVSHIETGMDGADTYYCKIIPHDAFGAGTPSAVGTVVPTELPSIEQDIDESIAKSDAAGRTNTELAALYDRNRISGGVLFDGTDRWVQYQYAAVSPLERIDTWLAAAADIYFALSVDGTTWTWLKAEADHTLDADDRLLVAVDEADARTNYWTLTPGANRAFLPAGLAARYVRLAFPGTQTVTVYEWIPVREIIAEKVVAGSLAALSAYTGQLNVEEGGGIVVGDGNIEISGDTNDITIAPDGGPAGQTYLRLTHGDLQIGLWDETGQQHEIQKPLTNAFAGTANNNETVLLPGVWENTPNIQVSLNYGTIWHPSYINQEQAIRCEAVDLQLQPGETKKWRFVARATLEVAETNGGTQTENAETIYGPDGQGAWPDGYDVYSPDVVLPGNIYTTYVVAGGIGWYQSGGTVPPYCSYRRNTFEFYIQCRRNGSWSTVWNSGITPGYQQKTYVERGLRIGNNGQQIERLRARVRHTGNLGWDGGTYGTCGSGYTAKARIYSYTQEYAGADIIRACSLNWIATGR